MGKHKKTKRLSIERTIETESPDVTHENTSNNNSLNEIQTWDPAHAKDKDKEDKGCKCCGVLDCFKIETNNNNNINGNNNVIDNNKETSLNIGINSKK